MLRNHFLFILCICSAFLPVAPVYAQADGEWRPMLPTQKDEAVQHDVSDADGPELLLKETPAKDRGVPENEPEQSVRVGSVLIEATPTVDHAMFDAVIEPLLGTNATNEELAQLAQQIAEVARTNGMVLASAYVPQQQVELGIVKIVLRTGIVDEIRIEGSDNRALRDLLNPLVGKTVMQGELERRLMLASDIPQISVKQTELLVDGDRQILVVKVDERKKTRGKLVADNYGSRNIGPLRARLSVEAVALLDDSDFANVTFRASPSDPEELAAGSISYGVALNDEGTRAEFAAAWSKSEIDAGGFAGSRNARSRYASLAISHPLRRSRTSNLWVEGQFEYLKIDQDIFGLALQSDTVVTMSVGLSSSLKVGDGWLRTGTQLRRGLGLFGATKPNDPFSSRNDADAQFTLARAWANWSGKPVGNMTLRMAVSGQLAAEPLLSSEEMGLGGAYVGRAFDFFERSGDQGILALAELGYEFSRPTSWLNRFQPYVFMDGGYVDNLQGGFGGGTLLSAGGGFRGDIGPVDLQLEAAVPVHSTGTGAISSEPKVNFQLGLDF
jgi:hemolysin activation/secretion protein